MYKDPPVYDLLNPSGSSSLMIACDHGGNSLPIDEPGLVADPKLMELHIAYDIGARQVAKLLSEKFDAVALIANFSRLLVDLNRYPGDPAQMPLVSDGHRIPGNEGLDQQRLDARLNQYFFPYHQQHAGLVEQMKNRFVQPLILSIHSFTPRMQGKPRPWHFGVLWDEDESLAMKLIAALTERVNKEQPPLVIGDNQPYSAFEPKGYAITEHAAKKGVEMALIEIRQDLLLSSGGREWAAEIIYDSISPLLNSQLL